MKRKAEDLQRGSSPKRPNTSSSHQGCFRNDLFTSETQSTFTSAYKDSEPYPHAVIPSLIQDELLRSVRKEITEHVHFTLKETDIYRIHQSGDLANLSKLAAEDLKHLPGLVTLRDALYSDEFRTWISSVTGAGKVSGTKTDMAVNVYTPGSYLLCHDDVIGSRRISYILYLTDPDEPWKPEWGGGLRFYPTEVKKNRGGEEVKVPLAEHTLNIAPSFGQLSFFAVQPGESYHDVEEVYYGKESKRIRMAISGWYHLPQEGEDGHEDGAEEAQAQKSSLAQLKGAADEFDEPKPDLVRFDPGPSRPDDDILTEKELTYLLDYITPQYLTPEMTEKLAAAFIEDSVIQLEGFLRPTFADEIKRYIETADTADWLTARPPHKHRFQYLRRGHRSQSFSGHDPTDTGLPIIKLTDGLLVNPAFRKWLGLVTDISPSDLRDQDVLARRFRRGRDYALASTYQGEDPRLEYTIGLTPSQEKSTDHPTNGHDNSTKSGTNDIHINTSLEDNYGGEEVYMAGDDDGDADSTTSNSLPQVGKKAAHDPAVYKSGEEGDDDAILFTDVPSWNTLSVVMRDQGTLRFVKYVSLAGRDRWDVKGEVGVDPDVDDEEDDEDGGGDQTDWAYDDHEREEEEFYNGTEADAYFEGLSSDHEEPESGI